MNPVSEDIKDLLVGANLGVFASTHEQDWGIFIGTEPASPDQTITIYDTPSGQVKAYNHNRPMLRSEFQIRVRARKYLDGHSKITAVRDALNRYGSFVVGTVQYLNVVTVTDDPAFLTRDERGRTIWVQNYAAFRQEQEAT